jgi:S1-C subfamily serine protease
MRLNVALRSFAVGRRIAFATLATMATITLAAGAENPMAEVPVVQIVTTYQTHNPFIPWQKLAPRARIGFGVLVAPGKVLTTETVVRNQLMIELARARSGAKIPARVIQADPEANLALLEVLDPTQLADLQPIPVAAAAPDSTLSIAQLDETREFQAGNARLVRILVDGLPEAPFQTLTFKVLVDLDVSAPGAPVIVNDALVGIAMSYDGASRTAMLIPYPALAQFIDDLADGRYDGLASAGFLWQPLVDPVKRRYLGADGVATGVQVLSCLPRSGADGVLQPMDMVLEWDGQSIDNMGYYLDDTFGRLLMPHLIKKRRPGDTVPVTILRAGKRLTVQMTLSRYNDENAYVPENITATPDDYLVEGGLVMYALSGRWLHAHGRNWQAKANSRLVHLYLTKRVAPEMPGDRIVLLATVLPHDINIGYQHLRTQIVEQINGSPVRNLEDVFRIRARDGNINRLRLKSFGIDLVLDADRIAEANREIREHYNLPALQRQTEPHSTPED